MLPKLISTIFTYLNAGGYYKTAIEIKNAINTAQIQLYKKLRGNMGEYAPMRPKASVNFEENNVVADSLGELYRIYTYGGNGGPIVITSTDNPIRTPDVVEALEINYQQDGDFYPVNIVPDNQYLMMKNNKVIYPDSLVANTTRPLGRMNGLLTFEVYPSTFYQAKARVLTLPTDVNFKLIDMGGETPFVEVITDTDYTDEKFNNLLFLTLSSLGFNLSNGVIVQAAAQKEFKEL